MRGTLSQGGFAGHVAILAGGAAFSQGLAVLASPLLTRLYSPADFGAFAIFTALLSVLMAIASLRYEQAIPLPKDEAMAANLLALSLLLPVALTLATMLAVSAWGGAALRWLNAAPLLPYLWLLPISLLGGGAYQALSAWAVRVQAFPRLARTRVSQGIGLVAVQLSVGAIHAGPFGLLLGDAVGRMSGTGVLATLARTREVWGHWSARGMRAAMARYVRFPAYTTGATLLNIVSLQLPFVLLSRFFSTTISGHYALSFRVLGLPSMLLGQAIGQVFFARAAQVADDPPRLRALTERTAIGLFAVGLPVCVLMLLAGPPLFTLAFGHQWEIAGRYAQILAPWFLLWLISSPLSGILAIREWQGASLVFTVFEFGARFLAVAVGHLYQSALLAVILLSASGMLIAVIATAWFFRGAYGNLARLGKPIGRILLVALVLFVPVAATLLSANPLVRLGGLGCWVAGYYAAVWALRARLLEGSDGG